MPGPLGPRGRMGIGSGNTKKGGRKDVDRKKRGEKEKSTVTEDERRNRGAKREKSFRGLGGGRH